jgi:hypothetical protein
MTTTTISTGMTTSAETPANNPHWSQDQKNAYHAQAYADMQREKATRLAKALRPANNDGHQPEAEVVMVGGIERGLTTLDVLNERFGYLKAPGLERAYISREDLKPISRAGLESDLETEVVFTGNVKDKDGTEKPVYKEAFAYWTKHRRRHVFTSVAFTSKALPDNTLNLFRGFGVKPRNGECKRIIEHICEVICSGNTADGNAMLDLLAWQMQHIGEPSRVITSLTSERHQTGGKGIIFERLMMKIHGPSGFTVSQADQVLGRFNDALLGRTYLLFDEVMFAGNIQAANALKRLATASSNGIEGKYKPSVTLPIAVNAVLLSNQLNAAYIEEHDARYWALNVSDRRAGDDRYFEALVHEVDHGGAPAFAHYLLNRDVSAFLPFRDVPKANATKLEVIRQNWNAHDPRRWLEDCCELGSLIGMRDGDGTDRPWEAGEEHNTARLNRAYVEWQKGKRPRGVEDTSARALGVMLTKCGFDAPRHSNGQSFRKLPKAAECLAALRQTAEIGDGHSGGGSVRAK